MRGARRNTVRNFFFEVFCIILKEEILKKIYDKVLSLHFKMKAVLIAPF